MYVEAETWYFESLKIVLSYLVYLNQKWQKYYIHKNPMIFVSKSTNFTIHIGKNIKMKLPNFKFFLIFWKYKWFCLTYISNLVRGQKFIELARFTQKYHFFAHFCHFWQKYDISPNTMLKKSFLSIFDDIIIMLDWIHMELGKFAETNFWSWATSSTSDGQ